MSRPPAGLAVVLDVVLDANALYPQWLRDVVLTVAAIGYYDPVWSLQIIDEMRRNVLADHPDIDPAHFDDTTIAALRRAVPLAWSTCPTSSSPRWTTRRGTAMSSPRR